jgi:hypothetical protein
VGGQVFVHLRQSKEFLSTDSKKSRLAHQSSMSSRESSPSEEHDCHIHKRAITRRNSGNHFLPQTTVLLRLDAFVPFQAISSSNCNDVNARVCCRLCSCPFLHLSIDDHGQRSTRSLHHVRGI